jgi:DNA-damage-inducible protein J
VATTAIQWGTHLEADMTRDAFIRTRTDSYLKDRAEVVFKRLGINMTDAINMFLAQVALRDGLPFDVSVPSEDVEFQKMKQAAIAKHRKQLNKDIRSGISDIEKGKVVSDKDFEKQLRKRVTSRKPQPSA